MRNLRVVRKFTSTNPLPLPSSSIFCAGENGCLFGCVKLENDFFSQENSLSQGQDDAELIQSEVESNLPPPNQFLSNLIRISEYSHIEELTKSNFLQDTFSMQYVPSTECLFMANTSGTLLQYQLNTEVEELLTIEIGISSFTVSPDSRYVIIITKSGSMILLTLPHLETVVQMQLVTNSEESEGKEQNDVDVTTCWRQDGRYFVVNVPNKETGRQLKVFDETGTLFSNTENTTMLLSTVLDWQPRGSLIAALEKSPPGRNTDTIVSFFELNGLKRSEFDHCEGRSTLNNDPIISLVWNSSSDLLAMRKRHCIELWYRSNYVWMCKSSIFARRKGEDGEGALDGIKFFTWDSQFSYKLHVVFESGYYSAYDFAFVYSGAETGGTRITASLNGSLVYFTPFRDNCSPPPFGFSQVSFPSLAREVVLNKFYDGFLCILSSGNVVLVQNQTTGAPLCKTFNCNREHKAIRSYGWIWPSSSLICGIKDNSLLIWELPKDALVIDSKSDSLITLKTSLHLNCTSVWPIYPNNSLEATHVVIQKACGYLLLMDLQKFETKKLLRIPANAFHTLKFAFIDQVVEESIISNLLIIGHDHLTRKLEVFLSPKYSYKLSGDCTSFEVFQEFLMYTTIQGALEIVHIKDLVLVLQSTVVAPNSNPGAAGTASQVTLQKYGRKIEKGSLIISCGLSLMLEPQLVLQILPRGNLETISPRPLIISSLKTLLRDTTKRDFETIMSAMRRHRINSNILIEELKLVENDKIYNVSLKQLLTSIVEQVNDSNLLVLFVTELNDDNKYSIELMRSILEEFTNQSNGKSDKGVLPYLASMAKLGLYEQVLHSKLILGESDREVVKSRIKFLSFYSDNSEILYEAALGTYDLTLTSIVSDCLNKDPKEYLPILNDLQALKPERRYFSIDNTLRRYSKAVRSLILDTAVEHDEIVKYVEKHKVFAEALEIVSEAMATTANSRDQDDVLVLLRKIQVSFAHHLEINGKYKEASILYCRGGNAIKAIDCSMKTDSWESAITIAHEEQLTSEELNEVYKKLMNVLESREELEAAARVSQFYLNDVANAIDLYIRAKKWITARGLALEHAEHRELVSTSLTPKLITSYKATEESLKTKQKEVQHYLDRLRLIKNVKAAKETGDYDGAADNFSDTESVSTTSTRSSSFCSTGTGKSYRSSKSKRKQERKLYSLKEGSQYEDIAITIYFWDLACHVQNEMKSDIVYTVESLWRYKLDDYANSLTASFDEFLKIIDSVVGEVWAAVLPEMPLLESKYRIPPLGWTSTWDKLYFLASSSSAVKVP